MRRVLAVTVTLLLLLTSTARAQGWTSSLGGNVTLSGVAALFPVGSDTRPSIAAQADTNTGIRFPAADQISFVIDGTRRGLLTSTGFLFAASQYLNFGTTSGTSGYGVRDNAGVIQFKDSGGSWINVASASSGAPATATYITQTADGGLTSEQALSSLSTGIMRVATATGVITSLTNSAGIAANISDETGTGVLVFGTSPTLTTPTFSGVISGTPSVSGAWTFANGSVGIRDTDDTHNLVITPGSNLTANRILRITTGDAERTITVNGDTTLDTWFNQDVRSTASPTFVGLTATGTITTVGLTTTGNTILGDAAGDTLTVTATPTITPVATFSGGIKGTTSTLAATGSNGNYAIAGTAALGLALQGKGSSNDLSVSNGAGTAVFDIPTGTTLLELVQGIRFPATQNASSGANDFDDYEEGTWTPADGSGAALAFSAVSANYVKMGQLVMTQGEVTYPATGSGANALISGFPFSANATPTNGGNCYFGPQNSTLGLTAEVNASATTMNIYSNTAFTSITNTQLSSKTIRWTCLYRAGS